MLPIALMFVALLALDAPQVPPAIVKQLDAATLELARSGRKEDVSELIECMQRLGLGMSEAQDLTKRSNAALAKTKNRAEKAPRAASMIQGAAKDLAKHVATLQDGVERDRLARLTLSLDASQTALHALLGEEQVGGVWMPPGESARKTRRAEIAAALRDARHLDVAIETGAIDHPILKACYGTGGNFARCGDQTLVGTLPKEALARILREALRATAVTQFLLNEDLSFPRLHRARTYVLLQSKVAYNAAVDDAHERQRLDDAGAERSKKLSGFFESHELGVFFDPVESRACATLYCYLAWESEFVPLNKVSLAETQACLQSGILSYTCLAYIGAPKPGFAGLEVSDRAGLADGTATGGLDDAQRIEREEVFKIAKSGLVGCRSFLAWLVRRHEDPPFASTLVKDEIDLFGVTLLKACTVTEFLLQRGEFARVLQETLPERVDAAGESTQQAFERSLRQSVTAFDDEWRAWIAPAGPSLAERLGAGAKPPAIPADQAEALKILNPMRLAAAGAFLRDRWKDVGIDASLSSGCRAHARYLAKHPEQAAAWPDAHEEFADRPDFSAEGAWAGMHSVVAPGQKSPRAAIDAWMGTFYHRLPLLAPNLLRIGFALENDVAVLDSGSIVFADDPSDFVGWKGGSASFVDWLVTWPPPNQKSVPTRFAPELPNPVPGADPSSFGFPITVQSAFAWRDAKMSATMELRSGSKDGPLVDCHFSSPEQPTNPLLAPEDAWCLIPKAPLKSGATYFVKVEMSFATASGVTKRVATWKFDT